MTGKVLVVDADEATRFALAEAISARGHAVTAATDGRTGLQAAVETSAEVVLVDRDIKVFDIRTFLDVLRDNPRTNRAAVLVMGQGDLAHLAVIDGRAEPIVKPFHPVEIANRVDGIVRRMREPSREPELRGDLSQVALWDLLQVFATSQRTGRLRVETEGASGDLYVREGRVVDATQGASTGEKAFYRIVGFERGTFHFVPGLTRGNSTITAGTEMLLMEAARRLDETRRVRAELPSMGTTLGMAGLSTIPPGIASELALRLDEPRTIEEMLDLLPYHDLEVLQVIAGQLATKVLVVENESAKTNFCEVEETPALRASALRLRRGGAEGTTRIGVVAARASDVARFARALARVKEFLPSSEAPLHFEEHLLGPLGRIRIGDTDVELMALPHPEALRPLWGAMLVASTTLIFLGSAAESGKLAADVRDLDLRIVRSEANPDRPFDAASVVRDALGVSGGRAYAGTR